MNEITRDFVSQEPRKFRYKVGHYLASSLSGFVVGVIVASIVWSIGIWYFKQVQQSVTPNAAVQHVTVTSSR